MRAFEKVFAILFVLLSLRTANAQNQILQTQGRVWLSVSVDKESSRWKAKALENSIAQFLASTSRLILIDALPLRDVLKAGSCKESQVDCILRNLRSRGIDIWVRGQIKIDGRTIELSSYETWAREAVATEKIDLSHEITLTNFQHRIFRLTKPFLEIGGLLDQHYGDREAQRVTVRPIVSAENPKVLFVVGAIVFILLMIWLPTILFRSRYSGLPLSRWLIFLSVIVPGLILLPTFFTSIIPASISEPWPQLFQIAKFFFGGIAWAVCLVLLFRFTFPGLRGLDRVNYFTIFPLLRAWIFVSAFRLVLFLGAIVPVAAFGSLVARWMALSSDVFLMIGLPISILFACICFLIWNAYLAIYVDTHLFTESYSDRRRWHSEIERYYRGYLRRNDLEIDEQSFKSIVFVPGKSLDAVSYGGGLAEARMLFNPNLLKLALGPLPEEDYTKEIDTGFSDLMAGTIVPKKRKNANDIGNGKFWPFKELPFFRKNKNVGRRLDFQAKPPFNLHNAAVLGYVIPSAKAESEALAADNREDFEALSELLTAHYAQFSKDQDDVEFDDTDPTDKDFFFGVLLREQGAIEQSLHFLNTIYLAFALYESKMPRILQKAVNFFRQFYQLMISKFPDRLCDSYAALNTGRNHLAQYLSYKATGEIVFLSARADPSVMYGISRQIFKQIATVKPDRIDLQPFRSTTLNRLIWLSEFFYSSIGSRADRRVRQFSTAIGVVIVFGVLVGGVQETFNYHSVYRERMQRMKEKVRLNLEKRQKSNQEQINGRE